MSLGRSAAPWQNGSMSPHKTLTATIAELRALGSSRKPRSHRAADGATSLARLIAACRTLAVEQRGSGLVFRLAGDTERRVPYAIVCWLQDTRDADSLTTAERAVAALLCDGNTLAQIAKLRGVSVNTVKSQVRHVFRKLDVDSRVALARRWMP
jgi:DNA-binding CsgD family transcriptional regulator